MTDTQNKESWEEIVKEIPVEIRVALAEHASKQFLEGIKNREREIAMEVEKMRKELSYTDYEHEAYNQTLDKILSIINTPR